MNGWRAQWSRRGWMLALALGAGSGAASSVGAQLHDRHTPPRRTALFRFGADLHAAMAGMVRDMEKVTMTGNPDRDFLAMMIPHHEGAVAMAKLVLVHGEDPLVRKLAAEIIAGQEVEITSMRNRLQILRAGRDPNPGGFPALEGTRGPISGGHW